MDIEAIKRGEVTALGFGEAFSVITHSGTVYKLEYLDPRSVLMQEIEANPAIAPYKDMAVKLSSGKLQKPVVGFFELGPRTEVVDNQPALVQRLRFKVAGIDSNGKLANQIIKTSPVDDVFINSEGPMKTPDQVEPEIPAQEAAPEIQAVPEMPEIVERQVPEMPSAAQVNEVPATQAPVMPGPAVVPEITPNPNSLIRNEADVALINQLQAEKAEMQKQINSLTATLQSYQDAHEKNKATIISLQNEKNELSGQIRILQDRDTLVANYDAENKDLKEQIKHLQDANVRILGENRELKTQSLEPKGAQEQVNSLTKQNAELTSELDSLKSEHAALQKDFEAVKAEAAKNAQIISLLKQSLGITGPELSGGQER